jgi:hypothetical protein
VHAGAEAGVGHAKTAHQGLLVRRDEMEARGKIGRDQQHEEDDTAPKRVSAPARMSGRAMRATRVLRHHFLVARGHGDSPGIDGC